MVNSRQIAAAFFILSAIHHLSYADIYKWKDSEGKLRYSDFPPRSDTSFEVINKKKNMHAGDASQSEGNQVKASNNLESKEAKGVAGKSQDKLKVNAEKLKAETKQLADENAAINAENCQAAQSNLATYKNGGRIKHVNERGEVQYLTDADIASATKTAQKDVEKYCNATPYLVGR